MCETCVKRGKLIMDCSGSSQKALFNFELCHTQESGKNMARILQKASFLCPPLSPRVQSNSCPLSGWYYLTISSSVAPFFFCASGSFPVSWPLASVGQSIGASASGSVLPMNIQGCFPLGLTGFPFTLNGVIAMVEFRFTISLFAFYFFPFFVTLLSFLFLIA